ncbi:DUF4179 domain-containing protein [Paenibacillus terreus]|uniref:DUF4179 domain-containing protein n=1 Tax=Paenibacillus terreus TaxID=1387834 RepID=A0ABV5BAW3_9BACL
MADMHNGADFRDVEQVEQLIRDTSGPSGHFRENLLQRIGEIEMKKNRRLLKTTLMTASAAAVMGVAVVGSGFVSPVMADALKNVPLIGSVFTELKGEKLQEAVDKGMVTAPNLSVTHDGITLKVSDVLYDGTRLSVAIEREGASNLENMLSPYPGEGAMTVSGEPIPVVPEEEQEKGYLEIPDLLIDGKELEIKKGMQTGFGDYPPKANTAMYEITKGLDLPDKFALTLKVKVTRVAEPFVFDIPVEINKSNVVLQPNATKSYEDFSYTIKKVELTPASTRLVIDSTGPVPKTEEQTGEYSATMMYYDIVDENGNQVDQRMLGFFNKEPDTEYHVDEQYAPFAQTPKSITIKPYTFTVKKSDWSIVGEVDGSTKHPRKKTYYKELETTIPVK